MSSTPVLHAIGARVVLGAKVALDGVDFTLAPGEVVVLLGPNGSGKTTLVRALLGLVGLGAGRVEICGHPPRDFRSWERVGYVPQRATAATGIPASVEEVVLLGRLARAPALGRYAPADHAAAAAALDSVDLADLRRVPVATLSGGQQQRVLVARALVGEPDVLVLDEPISGVDVEHQEGFAATLASLARRGCAVLAVAHSLGVLETIATRAVVLQSGTVVYDGPAAGEQLGPGQVAHHLPPREEGASFGRVGGRP
jgi:zinc transport system ATP-binding protein